METDPYQPSKVPFFEALYGKNLISLGGFDAIENLFSDLKIKGLHGLDLGFGLGGVAFYLAEKYKMKVSGIEIHPWMVKHAYQEIPQGLSQSLDFRTYDAGELPFNLETFDLAYSKGVLNHVFHKLSLFKKIHAVLKQKALFVIADWIFPQKIMDTSGPLVCETMETYTNVLAEAGFKEIQFRDDSPAFIRYAKILLDHLEHQSHFIKKHYGDELFLATQKQHQQLIEELKNHQKMATRIVARK